MEGESKEWRNQIMEKISIQEIAAVLAGKNGMTRRDAELFVSTMFEVIQQELEKDNLVKVKGFGTFKIIGVEARESVNVNTGERVLIEGHGKITFTPDAALKELINKPFSQFETVILNDGIDFDEVKDNADESESDSESETDVEIEAEPKTEPEPVPEPEPAPEPEPEPEPMIVSENSENSDNSEDSEYSDNSEYSENSEHSENSENSESPEPHRSYGWIWWTILGLAACAVSFYIGFLYAQMNSNDAATDEVVKEKVVAPAPVVKLKPIKKVDSLKKDTTKVVKKEAETPKAKPVEVVENKQEATKPELDEYEKADVRVKTGAYKITGLAQEVTVKAGDNLNRIATRYLGEGMICYLSVYNGMSDNAPLKEGQKIRIPQLVLKKKLKK